MGCKVATALHVSTDLLYMHLYQEHSKCSNGYAELLLLNVTEYLLNKRQPWVLSC